MRPNISASLRERIHKLAKSKIEDEHRLQLTSLIVHSVIFKEHQVHVASEARFTSDNDHGYVFDFRIDVFNPYVVFSM